MAMTLKPGREAEYERRHDEIWPELVEQIRAAGVSNFTLFRRGLLVFGYLECRPDAATALGRLDASEAMLRWGASLEDVIEPDDAPGPVEVWHLD